MDDVKIIREIIVKSYDDFVEIVSASGTLFHLMQQGYVFRGHSSSSYELLPSVLRKEKKEELWSFCGGKPVDNQSELEYFQIYAEYTLLQKFYRKCDLMGLYVPEIERMRNHVVTKFPFDVNFLMEGEKWLPENLYGITALAQHYGVPTRLLDWTNDFFISLYFAVSGIINEKDADNDNMVIWALNATYIDFISSTTSRLPLKVIRPRYYGNPNMSAQSGLFTLWEIDKPYIDKKNPLSFLTNPKMIDRTSLDKLLENICPKEKDYNNMLFKICIPHKLSKEIYNYLSVLGYDAARVFPGYSGVVRNMQEDSFGLLK